MNRVNPKTGANLNALFDGELTSRIRQELQSQLMNLGVIAAFMSGLSGAIYTSPPSKPLCYGKTAIEVQLTIQWIAMGCFYFAILGSVMLSMDISGVPDRMLFRHIHRKEVRYAHAVPALMTAFGVQLAAFGYGIDIVERNGCRFKLFGYIMAPVFSLSTLLFGYFLRVKRSELNKMQEEEEEEESGSTGSGSGLVLGRAVFNTWDDLLPKITPMAGGVRQKTRGVKPAV
jgi:hypothetical protein